MRISCFDIPSTVNDLLMKGEEQLLEMEIMYHGQSWALVSKLFVAAQAYIKLALQNTQLTFTCSKPTIEILEKGVKYVQS